MWTFKRREWGFGLGNRMKSCHATSKKEKKGKSRPGLGGADGWGQSLLALRDQISSGLRSGAHVWTELRQSLTKKLAERSPHSRRHSERQKIRTAPNRSGRGTKRGNSRGRGRTRRPGPRGTVSRPPKALTKGIREDKNPGGSRS